MVVGTRVPVRVGRCQARKGQSYKDCLFCRLKMIFQSRRRHWRLYESSPLFTISKYLNIKTGRNKCYDRYSKNTSMLQH